MRRLSVISVALVLALFCLPLFVGLGRTDLQNDEAIYSFAVDRILETGHWLTPASSPDENAPFFEKPPLKFWIVAAPMRLGLLPHNEFGLRFWDALFGSAAFIYVLLIGRRVAGWTCGMVAVAVLFVHEPLVFEHGLRSNNMEGPLVLAYCGGIYHFLEWMRTARRSSMVAIGLYFVLGFMTKFVAALFLPIVLVVAAAFVGAWRRQMIARWRDWAIASLVAVALIVPWFVYEHVRFGSDFWEVLFAEHVVKRMTVSIDPGHLHPWNFYFTSMYEAFSRSGTNLLVVAGGIFLLFEVARRRRAEDILLMVWFAVPMILISISPSKLYHYAYPYLPPAAIAAGLLPGRAMRVLQPYVDPAAEVAQDWLATRNARLTAFLRRPAATAVLLALASGAIVLALLAAAGVRVGWAIKGVFVLRNALVLRPWLVAFILAAFAGRAVYVARLLIPLIIATMMPWAPYEDALSKLPVQNHPKRDVRDCVRRLMGTDPPPGVHVQLPPGTFLHPYYYYFRRFGPWEWIDQPDDRRLYVDLWGRDARRPVLVSRQRYLDFRAHLGGGDPAFRADVTRTTGVPPDSLNPMSKARVALEYGWLVLPDRYAECGTEPRAIAAAR